MPNVDISSALGADLYIGSGDLVFSASGDLALVSQLDMISQRLFLTCIPDKGSVLLHPDLGVGLASAVQTPLTDSAAQTLADNAATLIAADPAVTSVSTVVIDQPIPKALQLTPVVTLVGGLSTALQLPKVL